MAESESVFESFTAYKEVDGTATLTTRVFHVESTKDNGAVVQECKRRFTDEYGIAYNSLKGHTLHRDGNDVWVSITPKVWEDI